MRTLALTVLAAAAALAATAAAAAPREMNDATYIAVARCAGMAEGLGSDAKPFTSVLDQQSGSRMNDVLDRADQVRADSKRSAAHAGTDTKADYTQQLGTACKSYVAAG